MPAFVIYGNLCLNCAGCGVGNVRLLESGKEEKSGQEELVGGPKSLNIIESSSISPLAWKMGSFKSSSPKMHPTDHISIAVEYVLAPNKISGAL